MHTTPQQPTTFTLISFDQLCQTLYEAVQGLSDDILLTQYDLGESASCARISLLRASDGKVYALIQIEEHAARTSDVSEESINQAVLALIEVSGCRIGPLLECLRLVKAQADAGALMQLH